MANTVMSLLVIRDKVKKVTKFKKLLSIRLDCAQSALPLLWF